LTLLRRAHKPMTAYALLDRGRRFGIGAPMTVYRALAELEKHGLAHKIESLNAWIACRHPTGKPHAPPPFAVCTRCGRIDEIDDATLQPRLTRTGHAFLADVDRQVLEIAGVCHRCAQRERPRGSK
jgi:Fur family zinc uptake transcriptional regulator